MNYMENYERWLHEPKLDADSRRELEAIAGDRDEIEMRFLGNLEFGTGGLRGTMGAGLNKMNVYTVAQATQGMAEMIALEGTDAMRRGVVIAYDSRNNSALFSETAAAVLSANGIAVYIFDGVRPTPELSFAIRHLGCIAGINITASHNPKQYNGYKAYGSDGCQMTIDAADAVLAKINALDIFNDVKHMPFDEALAAGMISYIGDDVIEDYFRNVLAQGINTDLCAKSGLKIVYTPLNGTGNKPVRTILNRIGIQEVTVVKEQENPDGNFTTCPYPNPEIREALQLGLQYCDQVKPDLLLATDPDADRVGIAVPDGKGGYALFSGNEVGAMLLEYICEQRIQKGTMPKHPVAVKTIVTTDIVEAICKAYGVELIEVLTGFKFIGEQIGFLEAKGEEDRYIFGFEESYGYLAGSYVRDKDAVVASMLICEMAAYYRTKGISMMQARENLYQKYGVYVHAQHSFTFEGESGMIRMQNIMEHLRTNRPEQIDNLKVIQFADYEKQVSIDLTTGTETAITLPKSNVLSFTLEQSAKVIIRPSGTEPKIKAYYTTTAATEAEAAAKKDELDAAFSAIMLAE